MKPFLKWAGGKRKLAPTIVGMFPKDAQRLIEPFVGGGAVFLASEFDSYVLGDANHDLMSVYASIHRRGNFFASDARAFFRQDLNRKDIYLSFRKKFNEERDPRLFLYLNRHCYNGLCRYNQQGEFNVPFGKYKKPYFPDEEMRYFADKLHRTDTQLHCQDFTKTMAMAGPGDVVYCDPPYVPLSNTANFTSYSRDGFSLSEQVVLVDMACEAANRGATVLISNHDTRWTRELYASSDHIEALEVQRNISCNGNGRVKAKELIAIWGAA